MNTNWEIDEISILKANYQSYSDKELCALLPNRTQFGIRYKRERLGLKRSKNSLDLLRKKGVEAGVYNWKAKISLEEFENRYKKVSESLKKAWKNEKRRYELGLPQVTKFLSRTPKKPKMSLEDVLEILENRTATLKILAQKFGITEQAICMIRKGKLYKCHTSKIWSQKYKKND